MKRLMYMCGCYYKAKLAEPDFFFWKILKLLLNFLDAREDILIISFVGYTSQQVTIGNDSYLKMSLTLSVNDLDSLKLCDQ